MPASASVYWVKPETIDQYWPMARYWIEQACKRGPGGLNAECLRDLCKAGSYQLFAIMREGECVGAAVTTVVDEPSRKVLEWTALGGKDMQDWADLEAVILDGAMKYGCTAVRSYSRPGMKRRLKPRGYAVTGFILEKELV